MKSIEETKRFGLTQSLLDAVKSVVAAEAEDNRSVDQINASKVALKAAATAQALAANVGKPTAPGEDDMEPEDVPVDAEPEQEMPIDSDLDPVDNDEVDKDFDDREDQDIDNDGDVDDSDEYLHKRRAATDDAIDAADEEDIDINVQDDDEDEDDDESEDEDEGEDDEADDEGEEEDDEEDEDEVEIPDDSEPEADDAEGEPEMDDAEDSEDDEDEEEPVKTREVGDMSDDELEQELAMRKNKSKDKEEVEVNPQMEAYVRKIHGDVSKRRIVQEAVKEPYAVGMAQAMKSTGDEPPLKKSTITKAHDIAKAVAKKEELSPKQKKLDVNKDGKIGGDDLAKIRASKKEQLMANKSYYESKYGNRWETVMDKVADKMAKESSWKKNK